MDAGWAIIIPQKLKTSGKREREGMTVVRGINRRVVEVRHLDSDRFEAAIFFVRAECAGDSPRALKKRAEGCLQREFGMTAYRRVRRAALTLLGFAFSALAGAVVTLLVR